MDVCIVCKESLDSRKTVLLTQKGCDGISRASERKQDNIQTSEGQKVHVECRRDYCSKKYIKQACKKRELEKCSDVSGPSTRQSLGNSFQYKYNCLFCGQPDKYSGKKSTHKLIPVRTMDFQQIIKQACASRNDGWAETVLGRIECVNDLHAADAMYHQVCSVNFRTGFQIPEQFIDDECQATKRPKKGRPNDSLKADAFLKVVDYLESHDDEQTTVNELIEKMKFYLPEGPEPYGFTHMKSCLMDYFGDNIIITEINGKPNVVTFRHTAASIINEFYSQPNSNDSDAEKMKIIQTAAKLLKSDIKCVQQMRESYPDASEMSSPNASCEYLPDSLQILLQALFVGKETHRKVASIGQAIMQATRPRVLIAPLQLGLAVQLRHHFASRFLIDSLSEHWFCIPYHEVQQYERSCAVTQTTDVTNFSPGDFIQYMADNVDHNLRTIDGFNTFHGMGIIGTVTPTKKVTRNIPRLSVTSEDILAAGRIDIKHLSSPCTGLNTMVYQKLSIPLYHDDIGHNLDTPWNISLHLQTPRPSWSGMMQSVYVGEHPGTASVLYLPMIDLDPGNMSCIYSTLTFICDHAKRYNVVPMITFDQPLWWKALSIIESEPANSDSRNIILRLGGFHTLMSFLGCIGRIMSGSGIQCLLEQIYASNTVVHMLSGKAYDRAVRGHLLVAAALNTIISESCFGIPHLTSSSIDPSCSDGIIDEDDNHTAKLQNEDRDALQANLSAARSVFQQLMTGSSQADITSLPDAIHKLNDRIDQFKSSLMNYRTAKLWLQYLCMVDLLRRFIRSERTGNWNLHLQVLHEMLPYLAAAGHSLYTKSIYIYLQRMAQLSEDSQSIFRDGLHVVRRSDRFGAGLSTDLVIEQVLMRCLKTSGGLTRGRGMSEIQRLVWLLSRPACTEVNVALQEFTGVQFSTSEQHKDMSKTRQERDVSDTEKLIAFLSSRPPFSKDSSLHSIDTGVCASEYVNADVAMSVGLRI